MRRTFFIGAIVTLSVSIAACGEGESTGTASRPGTDSGSSTSASNSTAKSSAVETTTTALSTTTSRLRRLDTLGKAVALGIDQTNAIAIGTSGLMAIATDDGILAVWADTSTGRPEMVDTGTESLTDVAVTRDNAIVTVDATGALRHWIKTSGKWKTDWERLDAHMGEIRAVAISADERTVSTGGIDELVRNWNLDDGSPTGVELDAHDSIADLTYASEGSEFFVLTIDGQLLTRDGDSLTELTVAGLTGHSLAYADPGHLLISGTDRVVTIDTADGSALQSAVPSFSGGVNAISYQAADDAPALIGAVGIASGESAITVWDPTAPNKALVVGGLGENAPTAIAIDPSGSFVVFANYDEVYRQALVNQ